MMQDPDRDVMEEAEKCDDQLLNMRKGKQQPKDAEKQLNTIDA